MENQRKLRVGIITNPIYSKTGLGRNAKAWMPLLYKSNKYELFFLAQGQPDNNPDFLKVPWKSCGVFKNFDQQKFQNDPNYQRFVAYGNSAVESFVIDNKLDACFHIDDIWSSDIGAYLNSDWYPYIKENFVQWTTSDSEPILPTFKEWARKCPNMWFWSSFAERILKQENKELYGHCKTLRGAIKSDDFYPLHKEERLELRKKFNISPDEKIIIYLGRNQLRKLFFAHMEALKIWKQKNPNKKIRLLFHCSWNEPMGWNLNGIKEELGLAKDDILTTYYCKNCQHWNVQAYDGEDLNCSECNGQKTRVTAGVGSTISEKDLNKIYNLADASASIFTSGGQEYTNVESLLAGLPLACVNYSCGEDFCKNDFVYTIKGTFTREVQTSFKKFVPDIESVVSFYEYIFNISDKEYKEIAYRGRTWATDIFDAKNIARQIMEFLDNCKQIDWEPFINRKKEIKNINAQVQDDVDDIKFIKNAYKSILNMEVADDDSGLIHWKNYMNQPKDKNQLKQEVVMAMRNAGMVHNQKVQQSNTIESLLENNGKKHFVIVCPESAGDCLYTSATLESFRESYPEKDWNLYIATKPEFFELFDCNPYLTKILPYIPQMESEIAVIGQGNNKKLADGYCFITVQSQKFLNYLSNHNISIDLQN